MKTLLTLLIAILFLNHVNAQAPNWKWAKKIGGIKHESISNISNDASGNIYAVGTFESPEAFFGTDTLFYTGQINRANLFFAKYDSSGNVLWEKNLGNGGTSQYSLINCVVDNNDDIYIAGYFNSPAIQIDTITLTNTSTKIDMFIAKFDSAGNVLWAKLIGGIEEDNLYGLTTDDLGNFYISGVFASPSLVFNTTSLTKKSTADFFVAKYDSNGNNIWAQNFAGAGSYMYSNCKVKIDKQYNVLVFGMFISMLIVGNDTLHPVTTQDAMVIKLDSNGNALWTKSGGSAATDYISGLVTDNFGNVYAAGVFYGPSITFENITLYNTLVNGFPMAETFLVKYDEDGTLLWAKSFSGSGIEYATGLFLDKSENLYLIGNYGNFGTTTSTLYLDTISITSKGQYDFFISKLDTAGHAQWAKAVGSKKSEKSHSISMDNSGNIYLAGMFRSKSLAFGSHKLYNTDTMVNISDAYLAKIGSAIATGIENIENGNDVFIFPNPFTNQLTITAKTNEPVEFSLCDVTSRKILNKSFTTSTTINTAQFAKGIYLYEVRNKNGVIKQGKVVKD